MVELYGSHFEYAGISSRLYDLVFANVKTDRFLRISGDINGITVGNKALKRRYLVDNNYTDSPVSFDVDIITKNGSRLIKEDRRAIEKWLFNRGHYQKLYLDIVDDAGADTIEIINGQQKRLYMNCRFVKAERLEYNGGIIGYRTTIETDSGYWWQDEVEFTAEDAQGNLGSITVRVDTDIDDFTYPVVSFTTLSGGVVRLKNINDDALRITEFEGVGAGKTVVIDSGVNRICGAYGDTDNYYEKFKGQNFPRLVDGENKIDFEGSVSSVTFRFQNRRML